jgi:hypothetical protein
MKYFLLLLTVAVLTPVLNLIAQSADTAPAPRHVADNPVAEVRDGQSWEYGPFINWGKGIGDRSDFNFSGAAHKSARS